METSEIEDVLKGLPPNPQKKDVAKIVEKVRSRIIGQLRAAELAKEYPEAAVLREVEVLEEDTMTIEQFEAATNRRSKGVYATSAWTEKNACTERSRTLTHSWLTSRWPQVRKRR